MGKLIDLTGQKFGKLNVIKLDEERNKQYKIDRGKSVIFWLCKCDCGNPEMVSIRSNSLLNSTISCGCNNIESIRNYNKKKAVNGNSFAQYLIDTYGENALDLYWDWDKNTVNPWEINKGSNKTKIWVKCQEKSYHGSYKIGCNEFTTNGNRCPYCNPKNSKYVHSLDSFAQWGLDNICPDFLEKYWSDKNILNPWKITKTNNKKIWIRCQEKDYHGSYKITCSHFYNGTRCSYCNMKKVHPIDSFAQYHINNTDVNFLEKYWDTNKNIINPWEIAPNSHKKVWIICQNVDYHESYEIACDKFTNGQRCSFCSRKKIHYKDSFAYYHINNTDKNFLNKYWDKKKNDILGINPWNISTTGDKKVWIKCLNDSSHPSYFMATKDFTRNNHRCPKCKSSKGERKIYKYLVENKINFITQVEYDSLVGVGGGNLSYDFYLPNYNLLIEYQGEYHDGTASNQTEEEFKVQQEHDRRKKQYAIDNNIRLLEIWYWNYDKIEEILDNELN